VSGWIGDFFRFWWALFYWNTRKTWFRLRGAHRDDCPCQNVSDSGLAMDTRCEAVMHWSQPGRFRRVCPLLIQGRDGWRCSVEAEGVRPFWARAARYAGLTLLAVYLVGTVAAYVALRTAKYDVSYLSVVWPPRWRELRGSQEKLYAQRAQEALAKGNYQEAILSLEMVCQINPQNYNAGLALAALCQVAAQPFISEHVYERLMRDVPERRVQTAQIWFQTLLARSAYDRIMPLALAMLSEDPDQRGAWLNALLFSARQTHNSEFLADSLRNNPHLPEWCTELINIEQGLLENRLESTLPRLTRIYRQPAASYLPYYQVERLLVSGRTDVANSVLTSYGNLIKPDEATFLRLRIFHAKGWLSLLPTEYDNLLQYPLTPRLANQFCAYLIIHPSPKLLEGYFERFTRQGPPLTDQTVPLYQATYLAAAVVNDEARAEKIRSQLTRFTASDARVLRGVVELLKTGKPDPRLSRILPLVHLPTEVVYAILEHQTPVAPK
jgi:hypothetical protein